MIMPTLFPFLPYDPVETPLSFAARLAALHTGGRLGPFLRDLGIKPIDLAAGAAGAVKRLCDQAGVAADAALHNTARNVAPRRFDLRGATVSSAFFSSPDTVFCAACLLEDDAATGGDGMRRGRLTWTLRPVRTCRHHDIALHHRAPVHWDDRFHELGVRVPERGAALEDLAARAENRSVSPLQAYVTDRLEGRSGPDWLDAHSLEQAVRATEMLGALVAFGPRPQLTALTQGDWDRAGRVGHGFTARGERGILEAFEDVRRGADTQRKPGRRTMFGVLYEWLSASDSAEDPGDIKRILREHVFATMDVDAGETILGEALDRRRLHSVESLARESQLHPRTLRNVLVARGLVVDDGAGGRYQVFDAEAGRKIAAQVRRSVNVISLPRALNCTRPQANQILDERLLAPIFDGAHVSPGRTQKSVDFEDIEALLSALSERARIVDAVAPRFVPIAKAAEQGRATSGEILQLVLGGFLKTVVRPGDVGGVGGLHVDPVEVRARVAENLPGLAAAAAFGRLKIPVAVGWDLASRSREPCLEPMEIRGRNGHRFFRFDEDVVSVFASRFTTAARLGSALDIPSGKLRKMLKTAGAKPVATRAEIGLDMYRVEDLPEFCGMPE